MASIQKKRNTYYLVYDNPFSTDKREQIWVPINDGRDPELVLAEFLVKEKKGKLVIPNKVTMRELAHQWFASYGPKHWGYSTYNTNKGLVENHIVSEMGDLLARDVTSLHVEKLMKRLQEKKVTPPKGSKAEETSLRTLSSSTLRMIFIMLKGMFDSAVKWRIIDKECHPVSDEDRPVKKSKKRPAWSGRECGLAMQKMKMDGEHLLHAIFHTLFACPCAMVRRWQSRWTALISKPGS